MSKQTQTNNIAPVPLKEDPIDVDPWDDTLDKGPKPIERLVKLQLGPQSGQYIQLSRDLTAHEYRRIVDVLCINVDLFAWKPSDMPRIHPTIINHKLVICPQAKPVAQRKKNG